MTPLLVSAQSGVQEARGMRNLCLALWLHLLKQHYNQNSLNQQGGVGESLKLFSFKSAHILLSFDTHCTGLIQVQYSVIM